MKILFIYSTENVYSPTQILGDWTSMQFGVSYISSYLKKHGHQTTLLVLNSNEWEESTENLSLQIKDYAPDLVCMTAVYSQYAFMKEIAGFMKRKWPQLFLVIGGTHATLNPGEIIMDPFDAVCIGEGEDPVLELCEQLEQKRFPGGIQNLWIQSPDGGIEKNPTRKFQQDLDRFPFPDREMWQPWIAAPPDSELSILLGRGCYYNCTYCCNHALKKVSKGKYVRVRSPETIIEELAEIYERFPNRSIYFEVEAITLNKKWLFALCKALEAFNRKIGHAMRYGTNVRVSKQTVDENIFLALQRANFYKINIGLEHGSEHIRRNVLDRDYSNESFLEVVAMARKHNIRVHLNNMIGLPGETLADHMETVSLNRRCQPDRHSTGIFFPYPGTRLFDVCVEQGLLERDYYSSMERRKATLDLPGFSKSQIESAYMWFNYRVYKGHKPTWRLLAKILSMKVRTKPMLHFHYQKLANWPVLRQMRSFFKQHKSVKREAKIIPENS